MATKPSLPVQHRMSYEVCGEYDPKTKSYSIVRMPSPPRGRRVVKQHDNYDVSEIVEVRVACPHCLVDVEFGYVVAKGTRGFLEDMNTRADKAAQKYYERAARDEFDRRGVQNYLDSLEEFTS